MPQATHVYVDFEDQRGKMGLRRKTRDELGRVLRGTHSQCCLIPVGYTSVTCTLPPARALSGPADRLSSAPLQSDQKPLGELYVCAN